MTLSTTVRIVDPVNPLRVFTYCQGLLGDRDPNEQQFSYHLNTYVNHPGQGLCALLSVAHGSDGPLNVYDGPPGCVEVDFDTSYGYNVGGETCNGLHRRLTATLGAWLDDQHVDWWAHDEYIDQWHHRTPCPILIGGSLAIPEPPNPVS